MSVTEESADLMTVAEVGALVGRGEQAVRRWIATGRLPARRVLGRIVIRRADADKLMAGETVKPVKAGG